MPAERVSNDGSASIVSEAATNTAENTRRPSANASSGFVKHCQNSLHYDAQDGAIAVKDALTLDPRLHQPDGTPCELSAKYVKKAVQRLRYGTRGVVAIARGQLELEAATE